MAIEKGQPAPPFSLYDTEKNKVSLSDYKGRNVVLLFFPFAFSRVCTAELCTVRDDMRTYDDPGTVVLGISVDSLYTLNRFKKEYDLAFTLLSDFNKTTIADYGVMYESFAYDMQGVSKRAAFVIDRNGIVQYSEICASPADQPDFPAIQATIASLN